MIILLARRFVAHLESEYDEVNKAEILLATANFSAVVRVLLSKDS